MRGGVFLNGKEGRVGFRKKTFLKVKKDGLILENSVLSCLISRCNPREGVETQQLDFSYPGRLHRKVFG